jgi:hypothetical protein
VRERSGAKACSLRGQSPGKKKRQKKNGTSRCDFSRSGTVENEYIGGGGYIKRAWDETKSPLKRAKNAKSSLPTNMRNAAGDRASSSSESTSNWREHGERLGRYDAHDEKYDQDFAAGVETQN